MFSKITKFQSDTKKPFSKWHAGSIIIDEVWEFKSISSTKQIPCCIALFSNKSQMAYRYGKKLSREEGARSYNLMTAEIGRNP